MQRIARRITTATLLALAIYSGAVGAIALIGFQDHATPADIIVVPGNTVQPDGTVSARLQSRLDVALQLFHEGLAPTIFVSGGTGREGRDEAAAMAAYLVAQGVAPNAIITHATLNYATPIRFSARSWDMRPTGHASSGPRESEQASRP